MLGLNRLCFSGTGDGGVEAIGIACEKRGSIVEFAVDGDLRGGMGAERTLVRSHATRRWKTSASRSTEAMTLSRLCWPSRAAASRPHEVPQFDDAVSMMAGIVSSPELRPP